MSIPSKSDSLSIPTHIAVIMDGNGRWAKQRGLPRVFGHRKGVQALRDTVRSCADLGVKWLTAYSFSTENWQRPKTEVSSLMKLMASKAKSEKKGLVESNVRVRVIGRLPDIPGAYRTELLKLVKATSECTGLNLSLAISYGGRSEILDACRKVAKTGQAPIDEDLFRDLLYDPEIPDPELLIRTGGEQRISNYLLWQLAYTELYFTETLWPDFDRRELDLAAAEYSRRQRRFGRV